MIDFSHILAEGDPATKFIGVAVVVAIWIIGLITQSVKKQKEQQSKRRPVDLAQEIQRRLPPVQSAPRPQQRQQKPPRIPQQKAGKPNWNAIAKRPPAMPKQQQRRVAPPPPVQSAPAPSEVPVVQTAAVARQVMTGQPPSKPSTFVGARALNRWLTPATLRQQFIITELLQRPMCDRDNSMK